MVWAEMVMGRNGHGPKLLWAEMNSDLNFDWSIIIFGNRSEPLGIFRENSE